MNVPLRVIACAVLLFGAVLFVGCVLVPWLGGPSLFPHDLPGLCVQILEERQRSETLEARDRIIVDDLEAKRIVTDDLIGGRITLAEAISEFRRLREQVFALQEEGLPAKVPEIGYEGLAQQVINWVMITLKDDPRRDVVLDRLEAELDALRQR